MTWLFLLILLAAPLSASADAKSIEADLPCVVCHPSRDRAAYDALKDVPGAAIGSESAQSFVCYSCHNGTVVDDRYLLQVGGQHPDSVEMGVKPPKVFPLYEGKVECGTCHSPHGETSSAKEWLRTANDGVSTCAGCHGKHDAHIGRPLDSSYLSEQVALYGGRLDSAGNIVCLTCHKPHGALAPKLLIENYGPQKDDFCRICHYSLSVKGNFAFDKPVYCADCHSPFSKKENMIAGGDKGLCAKCHAAVAAADGKNHEVSSDICSECHSMHNPVLSEGAAFGLLRLPMTGGMLCKQCHETIGPRHNGLKETLDPVDSWLAEARGMRLEEVGGVVCSTCHKSHEAKDDPLLAVSGDIICLYCHPAQNPYGPNGIKPETHSVSVPLSEEQQTRLPLNDKGAEKVLFCLACHSAHGSPPTVDIPCLDCHSNKAQSAEHGGLKGCSACHSVHGDVPPVVKCEGCHEEAANISGHGHDSNVDEMPAYDALGRRVPWGGTRCPTCHDPHGKGKNMLRVKSFSALCLTCHEDKKLINGGPHDGKVISPQTDDSCEPCHSIHASYMDDSTDPMGEVCQVCHGNELKSQMGHGPKGSPVWKILEGKLPLFDRSGERNPLGFISCPSCHDVHRGKGDGAMRAGRKDPAKLCLLCHPEKKSVLGTSHSKNAAGEEVDCVLCHKMHYRGDIFSIQDSEAAALGSWNDRKCSRCHKFADRKNSKFAGNRSHPVNVPLEMGVQSPFPLYDPLGGRAGRLVTCSSCHDVHGIMGGSEMLPFYLRTGTSVSELCLGCHTKQTSILGTQHDLKSKSSEGSGPCGTCHVVHGANEEKYLWRYSSKEKDDYLPNRLCRTCHKIGGIVDTSKLLQYHMMDAESIKTVRGTSYIQKAMFLYDQVALNYGADPILPLFDRQGNSGPEGSLQCISCHDVHQWSPLGPFVKPGFGNLAPNVTTKFLEHDDMELINNSVCVSCHGEDVVEHYLRYHEDWEKF